MNNNIIKDNQGRLYEVIRPYNEGFMVYELSNYDGMPIGLPQYLLKTDIIPEDVKRFANV